ncbi:MAG: 5-deoxy-glucuronate isomerase [Actinobacteria bacterium 69-20]|nr:MAG: 5-deoxy-glucuronate isomerase [Actinobacteria bacterium 69-20]
MRQLPWVYRRGELAHDGWVSVVDESLPGWQYAGLRIANLDRGASVALSDTGMERLLIPLAGSFEVIHGTHPGSQSNTGATHLAGRTSVFAGPTDVLYLPFDHTAEITGHGRIAVAEARTDIAKPVQHIAAAAIPVELRGAGRCSRQVHNLGTPQSLDAARLIVCEVLTPEGNTSSYPPHKHDTQIPGRETRLAEIYYFEPQWHGRGEPAVLSQEAPSPEAPPPEAPPPDAAAFALFTAYSSEAGQIDIETRVGNGDIALIPYGYHGPAVAVPGYDLYYLNVMAGPDPEREWRISDDPAYAWIRDTWAGEAIDPRLPFRAPETPKG